MPCDICCEKFTKAKRKEIKCRFCQKSACVKCIETYLLGSIHKPHCMHCRKEYPYDFLIENFTKSLINKFRNHLSNINFEREKTRLPQAQQEIEKQEILKDIEGQIFDIKNALRQLKDRYHNVKNGNIKQERVQVTRPCPENDCRGFLSSQWKCGVCHLKFCPHCHDKLIKDVEHTCDEEKVKSAELIRKQCKNCPKCGASTFKISGCPQMWCTSCHTAWNWNSGRIEDKIIHNPHYFEYLREQGRNVPRNPLDVPCGGLMRYQIFYNILPRHMKWLAGIHRLMRHINHYEVPVLDRAIDNDNLDLRVKYLKKQIDEKGFKSTLKRREKIRNRATEYKEIFTMFVRVLTDLLINLQGTLNNQSHLTAKNCDNFINEYVSLQKYANTHFRIIGKRFKSGRVPQIMRSNRNEFYVS